MKWIKLDQTLPGISLITLARSEKRNALSQELISEFTDLMKQMVNQTAQRVIILNAEGSVFCAGLDLMELAQGVEFADALQDLFQALQLVPQVTIAAIQGPVLAGGMGLVAACDLSIAAPEATFAISEVRRGLVAALILALLKERLPESHLCELVLLGEPVTAQRAAQIALISEVVPSGYLLKTAFKRAHSVMQGAPSAIHRTKQLLARLSGKSLQERVAIAIKEHRMMHQTAEAEEGVSAFLEKRLPSWTDS